MDEFSALAKRFSNWGRWGKDDERGTTNLITPERLVAAAKLVKQGKVFDGAGPSVVVVSGMAKTMTSTTMQKDIYAFVFSQQGLMAGVGLQGNKITKLKK